MSTLQTLDRGLKALSVVAANPAGITTSGLADELKVARPICYRIVATLQGHGLLARGADRRIYLGAGLPALAAHYWPSFQALASPRLQELANKANATAFLAVAEGSDSVAVLSLDPQPAPPIQVGYRVGSRHPLVQGAAGIAILSARRPTPSDNADVIEARSKGFSITKGHLQRGAIGVAVPLPRPADDALVPDASIGLVSFEGFDAEGAVELVLEAARQITDG